jgi:hypothetical protein
MSEQPRERSAEAGTGTDDQSSFSFHCGGLPELSSGGLSPDFQAQMLSGLQIVIQRDVRGREVVGARQETVHLA